MALISRVYVESGVLDGGHSPVILDLRSCLPWAIDWKRPHPRLPDWLYVGSRETTRLMENAAGN